MNNEVSSRAQQEEGEVVAEPNTQLQENATRTNAVPSRRRATKKVRNQTPKQKENCAREHRRLLLMNEAYNKLRLLLDLPAKATKVDIVKNTALYIEMMSKTLQQCTGGAGPSGTPPDQTPSVIDHLSHLPKPNELSSIPPEVSSRPAPATTVEPNCTGSCLPQHVINELGAYPKEYTIFHIPPDCIANEPRCLPSFSELQASLASKSLHPLHNQIHADVLCGQAAEITCIDLTEPEYPRCAGQATTVEPNSTGESIFTYLCLPQHDLNELGAYPKELQACLTSESLHPLDNQTHADVPCIDLTEDFETFACVDGASQEQVSVDNGTPLESAEQDGAIADPFDGWILALDRPVLQHQRKSYSKLIEDLKALYSTVRNATADETQ